MNSPKVIISISVSKKSKTISIRDKTINRTNLLLMRIYRLIRLNKKREIISDKNIIIPQENIAPTGLCAKAIAGTKSIAIKKDCFLLILFIYVTHFLYNYPVRDCILVEKCFPYPQHAVGMLHCMLCVASLTGCGVGGIIFSTDILSLTG